MRKFIQLIEDFDPSNDKNPVDVSYEFIDFLKSNNIKYGRVKSTNTFYVHDKVDLNKVFVIEVKDVVNTKPSEEDGEVETVVDTLADTDPKAAKAKQDRMRAVKVLGSKALPKYVQKTAELSKAKI
jgi:hypothetical protein